MIIIKDRPHINAYQAANILQEHTSRGGVLIDLDRAIDYKTYYMYELRHTRESLARKYGVVSFEVKPQTLHYIAENILGEDMDYFKKNLRAPYDSYSNKYIADSKTLKSRILKGLFKKETVTLIEEYSAASKLVTARNNLSSYINLPILDTESIEGHRVGLAKPTWVVANTGRIQTQGINIQGIPRNMCDLVTTIPGWILIRCDSGQIEPRVTYSIYIKDALIKELIILYDDAYYGLLHYILLSPEEEKALRDGSKKLTPMVITPEIEAMRQDLKTMSLAGNYGGSLNTFDPKITEGFLTKIQKHPLRLQWAQDVSAQLAKGDNIFRAFFGTPIIPKENSKYKPGEPGWEEHVERCGINNPVQATAAELMCESVYYQDKLLREKGSGKSWIGFYKHDEALTYIHDSDLHLKDEIADCTSYQVLDWIPIRADKVEGIKRPKSPLPYELAI